MDSVWRLRAVRCASFAALVICRTVAALLWGLDYSPIGAASFMIGPRQGQGSVLLFVYPGFMLLVKQEASRLPCCSFPFAFLLFFTVSACMQARSLVPAVRPFVAAPAAHSHGGTKMLHA